MTSLSVMESYLKADYEGGCSLSSFGDCLQSNDLPIGWQNLNLLSHPIMATLVSQARASGENLNYVILVPQARQEWPSD